MTAVAETARPRADADARVTAVWLLTVAAMVFAMTVIGAITRLTESGLSMVEWRPLIGAIPPLSDAEWQRVFDLYRETPEYRLRNAGMGLEAFKTIFFWEWFHRLWGRLIGVAYALPLVWLWVAGRIPPQVRWHLVGLFILGGLQGLMGWYMVLSGLVDRPSVSHYRLAAHLGLAILIYGLLIWTALGLLMRDRGPAASAGVRRIGWIAFTLVIVTVFWGALVAGLDAGIGFNTWPLMAGDLLPPEALIVEPPFVTGNNPVAMWLLPFENHAMVQFVHRWLAIVAALAVLAFWWRVRRSGIRGLGLATADAMAVTVVIQVALGIATLLTFVAIPLAAAHQAGALILIALMLMLLFRVGTRGV